MKIKPKLSPYSVENIVTPENIEEQEHLSLDRLKKFGALFSEKDIKDNFPGKPRPLTNFMELMNWTQYLFEDKLKDKKNINKLVHNRVIIDGQFLHFCELNNISVECLYKDSIISWKTDHDFEKFFIQGVFLIKTKEVEFLHSALFTKGNQFEDEINFFILVSDSNYGKYVELRNNFDNWVQQRDRSNLNIHVVDGDDIPYTRDYSWDNLFLPVELKTQIKNSVEAFLSSKDFYISNKIPWKRGILMYGAAGCGKTSLIRTVMSVYNFKPVTIVSEANNESIREAFSYAEEQSPSLLFFEDLDSLFDKGIDISTFLNLMDGISSKNGLLVMATANNIGRLKANITDRPSRFDRKFEIPLPNEEMAYIYLSKWFGNLITPAKCKEFAKYAVQHNFSYAYLKEFYISSMFEALANNRKVPTLKDIQAALKILVKDKNILNKTVSLDKYLR